MSEIRLGGIILLIAAIFNSIPFFIGVIAGGLPPEGASVFTFFSEQVASKPFQSSLFFMMSGFASVSLAYGLYALNNMMQKKAKDSLLGLGTFFVIFGLIGFTLAWSLDFSIVNASTQAEMEYSFSRQMGIYMPFGFINSFGWAIFLWAFSSKNFVNKLFNQILALASAIVAILFIYTSLSIDRNDPNTIMPLFMGLALLQLLATIWQLLVGRKMMKS